MLKKFKEWVREIVREEIRESFGIKADMEFIANNPMVNERGEIIKLNETAQFLKENEDKTISIGQVVKDEDY